MALNLIGEFQRGAQTREGMRQARESRETRNLMKSLLAGGVPTAPAEREAFTRKIGAATGDPTAVLNWQKYFASQKTDELDRMKKEAPFVAGLLRGVEDPETYAARRAQAVKAGIDTSDWPEEYDPAAVRMAAQGAAELARGIPDLEKLKEGETLTDPLTGAVVAAGPEAPDRPFEGTSPWAQSMNTLIEGDPSTPEYAAAYSYMAKPRTYFDSAQGQLVTIGGDVTAFRKPTYSPTGTVVAAAKDMPQPVGPPGQAGVKVTQVGEPKFTKEEKDAVTFANVMQGAADVIENLEDVGSGLEYYAERYTPNFAMPPQWQQLEQAKRAFINAQLRRESGAVIGPSEFENANQQYLPQPGDSPEVIAQKRENRRVAIEGMKKSAGRAWEEPEKPKETGEPVSFEGMSNDDFLNVDITDANAGAWMKEADKRGLQ